MSIKSLRFQTATDLQEDLLLIEAVNEKGEILFSMGLDEKTNQIELWFTKHGAHVPFDLDDFRKILDEKAEELRQWAKNVKD